MLENRFIFGYIVVKFCPGDVGGEAPGSSKVKAALDDVRVCLDGADDKV